MLPNMPSSSVRRLRRKSPAPQFYPVSAIDYCTGYLMAFGAMVALARRTREGGSWLVRISLAQVGKWIVDLGEVPPEALKGIPVEFIASELETKTRSFHFARESSIQISWNML